MKWWRQHARRIAWTVVVALGYALALPAGAVPCVHHAAAMAAAKTQAARAHHDHAHFMRADRSTKAHEKAEHLAHELGCDCCIGGNCAGGCATGCSLPAVCCALLTTRLAASGPNVPAHKPRAAADTRADLSAPMIRPQAPRAPPAK